MKKRCSKGKLLLVNTFSIKEDPDEKIPEKRKNEHCIIPCRIEIMQQSVWENKKLHRLLFCTLYPKYKVGSETIMKYVNAADVLPPELLIEISKYAGGKLLYVPTLNEKRPWGEKSGSKQYYCDRNQQIREMFQQGYSVEELSKEFGLSPETVKRIVKKE